MPLPAQARLLRPRRDARARLVEIRWPAGARFRRLECAADRVMTVTGASLRVGFPHSAARSASSWASFGRPCSMYTRANWSLRGNLSLKRATAWRPARRVPDAPTAGTPGQLEMISGPAGSRFMAVPHRYALSLAACPSRNARRTDRRARCCRRFDRAFGRRPGLACVAGHLMGQAEKLVGAALRRAQLERAFQGATALAKRFSS